MSSTHSRVNRLLLGRLLLQQYRWEWLQVRETLDKMLERMVMGSPLDEHVQGGEKKTQQEILLELKERTPEYVSLARKIERMERILDSLDETQIYLVENYHWRGVPWHELARTLNWSQTTFYRSVYNLEEIVGREWETLMVG